MSSWCFQARAAWESRLFRSTLRIRCSGHGYNVGLLDLDLHGPTIPKMLGIESHKLLTLGNEIEPVHVTGSLSVISMALLLPGHEHAYYLARTYEDGGNPPVPYRC